MKALVTGGNGFLGRHVVRALHDLGFAVRILDLVRGNHPPEVERFVADLVTCEDLEAAFARVDVVVHLAASMRGGGADEVVHNTVEGSRRLFEAMARTPTHRIVLASSFNVYDWSKLDRTLREEDPTLDPSMLKAYDAYTQAKALQERLTRDFARRQGWTLTVLRPAVLWGAGRWGEFLIGARLGPIQVVVAPATMLRLVHVENAADAFARAAERVSGGEWVFNLIDPAEVTTWRYAGIVQQHLGGIRLPVPYRLGLWTARLATRLLGGKVRLPYFLEPRRFEALHKPVRCSADRLHEAIGWKPRFSFQEALARVDAPHA